MIVYLAVAGCAIGITAANQPARGRHRPTRRLIDWLRRPILGAWTALDLVVVAGLVLFSGFRFGVGSDYGLYTALYERLQPWDWGGSIARSPQELGFTVLSLGFRAVSDSPRPLFLLCSIVTVVLSYAAFKRSSSSLTLSVTIYILFAGYLQPFNTVRQGVAIALLLWANRFLAARWYVWLPLVVLAATFHTSALIAAVIQLVIVRWRPTLLWAAVVVVVLGVGSGLVLRLPPVVAGLSTLNPRYGQYLAGGGSGVGTYLVAAVWAAMLLASFLLLRAVPRDKRPLRWLGYGTLAVLCPVVGTFSPDAGRISGYFTPYFALLVPAAIAAGGGRSTWRIELGLVAAGVVYFCFFLASFGGLLPYAARLA